MKNVKTISYIVVSLLIIAFLADLFYVRAIHFAGDTAGYIDLLKRIAHFNDMRSDVFAAVYPWFELTQTVAGICSNQLLNTYAHHSFFQWHSYGIAFPIAWIGGLFTDNFAAVAAVVNAISVFCIFASALLIARKQAFNLIEITFFFLLLVSFTPLVGAISGQYYFDRLFIPLALFYCYLHLEKDRHIFWIGSALVIFGAALVSERSSLMIGALAIYLALFDTKDNRGYRCLTLGLGIAAIGYYVLWNKLFQDSYYVNIGSLSWSFIQTNIRAVLDLSSPISAMTRQLIFVLLPMIVLILGNKKYILLALAFLVPNVIMNVGGAEKIGFVTHYHSYYIPIFLFAALMGYSQYKQRISTAKLRYGLLSLLVLLNFSDIHHRLFVVGPALSHSISSDVAIMFSKTNSHKIAQSRIDGIGGLLSLIDKPNVKISGGEFAMPIMVAKGISEIRIFPIGLYDSDYLLLESASGEDVSHIILPIYSAPQEMDAIAKCLYPKIEARYIEIGRKDVLGINYRLLKAK